MRIWADVGGVEREAYKVGGISFDCYPTSTNIKAAARSFETIEEAALFLLTSPSWGIRMNPGSAIIYEGINIAR